MKSAIIQLERKPAWSDLLRSYQIVLDGKLVGSIRQRRQHSFEVHPGLHEIFLTIAWCSSQHLTLYLEPGEKVNLICQGRNTLLALTNVTVGAHDYIKLFREPVEGAMLS